MTELPTAKTPASPGLDAPDAPAASNTTEAVLLRATGPAREMLGATGLERTVDYGDSGETVHGGEVVIAAWHHPAEGEGSEYVESRGGQLQLSDAAAEHFGVPEVVEALGGCGVIVVENVGSNMYGDARFLTSLVNGRSKEQLRERAATLTGTFRPSEEEVQALLPAAEEALASELKTAYASLIEAGMTVEAEIMRRIGEDGGRRRVVFTESPKDDAFDRLQKNIEFGYGEFGNAMAVGAPASELRKIREAAIIRPGAKAMAMRDEAVAWQIERLREESGDEGVGLLIGAAHSYGVRKFLSGAEADVHPIRSVNNHLQHESETAVRHPYETVLTHELMDHLDDPEWPIDPKMMDRIIASEIIGRYHEADDYDAYAAQRDFTELMGDEEVAELLSNWDRIVSSVDRSAETVLEDQLQVAVGSVITELRTKLAAR